MIDNSRVILENYTEYEVVDKTKDGEISYVYLANPDDQLDMCVRKEIPSEEDNYLVGLDDREELDKAICLFIVKHQEMNK